MICGNTVSDTGKAHVFASILGCESYKATPVCVISKKADLEIRTTQILDVTPRRDLGKSPSGADEQSPLLALVAGHKRLVVAIGWVDKPRRSAAGQNH